MWEKTLYSYIMLIVFGLLCPLFAQAKPSLLPEIKRHSKTIVNASRGQVVHLKLEVMNYDQIFWYDRDEKICEGVSCKVMTGKLSNDFSTIGVVVINANGSQFIEFKINLKSGSKRKRYSKTIVPRWCAMSRRVCYLESLIIT